MYIVILGCWPLFLGLLLIGLGVGMQGSLLGVRATLEGFGTGATGLIMSGYYAGFFVGSLQVPGIIKRVGHVRTFGALSSLAATAILIHAVCINPWLWTLLRFVSGFSIIGIWLIAESWINASANNDSRGSLLSFYMIVVFLGLGGGQLLMNLGDPASFELFTLISILISLAIVPILITNTNAPPFNTPEKVKIKQLYALAPLGVVGSFVINGCYAMILGMGAVYATKIGLSVRDVSLFMGAMIFCGMVFQWPIGKISDRVDRRFIISACSFLAAIFAVGAALISDKSWVIFLFATLCSGFCLPLYSLIAAHTNDFLSSDQRVAANATLLLVGGLGSIVGPLFSAMCIKQFGPQGFFWGLALPCVGIGIYASWRMTRRPSPPLEERSEFAIHAPATVGVVFETEQLGTGSGE